MLQSLSHSSLYKTIPTISAYEGIGPSILLLTEALYWKYIHGKDEKGDWLIIAGTKTMQTEHCLFPAPLVISSKLKYTLLASAAITNFYSHAQKTPGMSYDQRLAFAVSISINLATKVINALAISKMVYEAQGQKLGLLTLVSSCAAIGLSISNVASDWARN